MKFYLLPLPLKKLKYSSPSQQKRNNSWVQASLHHHNQFSYIHFIQRRYRAVAQKHNLILSTWELCIYMREVP